MHRAIAITTSDERSDSMYSCCTTRETNFLRFHLGQHCEWVMAKAVDYSSRYMFSIPFSKYDPRNIGFQLEPLLTSDKAERSSCVLN